MRVVVVISRLRTSVEIKHTCAPNAINASFWPKILRRSHKLLLACFVWALCVANCRFYALHHYHGSLHSITTIASGASFLPPLGGIFKPRVLEQMSKGGNGLWSDFQTSKVLYYIYRYICANFTYVSSDFTHIESKMWKYKIRKYSLYIVQYL